MPAPGKVQLQYVVIPHPDDEFSAWSLIQNSPDNYPVFILLTRGEQTGFGDGHGLQADLGELVPVPQPFTGKGSANLKAQRVSSWHGFLDEMADIDPSLDSPAEVGRMSSPVGDFDLFVGASTARAVFDLGDMALTPGTVTGAIQAVRAIRDHFGVGREYGVIGAAYYNAAYPDAFVDTHPDHRAVHVALWNTNQGTPGPRWGRTAHSDPDVATAGRTNTVDPDVYTAAMGVSPGPIDPASNPGATRTGLFQRHYGWLAQDYWLAADADAQTNFGRVQTFWARSSPSAV